MKLNFKILRDISISATFCLIFNISFSQQKTDNGVYIFEELNNIHVLPFTQYTSKFDVISYYSDDFLPGEILLESEVSLKDIFIKIDLHNNRIIIKDKFNSMHAISSSTISTMSMFQDNVKINFDVLDIDGNKLLCQSIRKGSKYSLYKFWKTRLVRATNRPGFDIGTKTDKVYQTEVYCFVDSLANSYIVPTNKSSFKNHFQKQNVNQFFKDNRGFNVRKESDLILFLEYLNK